MYNTQNSNNSIHHFADAVNRQKAWQAVNTIAIENGIVAAWLKNDYLSSRAGYTVYTNAENSDIWVSDLADRLELNYSGISVNVWIDDTGDSAAPTVTAPKTPTPTSPADSVSAFDKLKRDYEKAYASGGDYSAELTALATCIAYSTVNKCIDPQRKTAPTRDSVSDNACNPALLALKRGIAADLAILDKTRKAANAAMHTAYNADGDCITDIADADADAAFNNLINKTLSDGVDLVQSACLAILEQTTKHGAGAEWLDTPYTVRRLSKRVYIQLDDSAAYKDTVTTPIQEIYRAVRETIQNSAAVQTDPRNGYSYIEDYTPEQLERIYHRLPKYADMGDYDSNGLYTASKQTAMDCAEIIARLELTDRQAQILRLRLQGKGYKAIATYSGVCNNAVVKTVKQIQKKALDIGLTCNK